MTNFDPVKFEELLTSGKKDEARIYVEECLNVELSKEESGKVLLSYTLSYMKAINSVNEAYKGELEEILKSLKEINKSEKEGEDRIGLLKVRVDLNS
jgi:hypothetical protein